MPLEDFPRDWAFDDSYRDVYEQLTDRNQTLSPFKGKTFADVFAFAMTLGFYHKHSVQIRKRSNSIPFLTSPLRDREWLIRAIAISESGGLDVMLDKPKIAKIAEEYANGGIELLKGVIFGGLPGDATKRIEAELREILDSL
jgi:dnd system-associated protein 4